MALDCSRPGLSAHLSSLGDGYAIGQWLDVIWLCPAHHAAIHFGLEGLDKGFIMVGGSGATMDEPKGLSHQIDITARTVFGEARGERGLDPLVAVAWVIKNRSDYRDKNGRPNWWGSTPAEVSQKHFQFSCWNADDPNLPIIQSATLDQPRFAQCYGVACLVLTGDDLVDPTNKATHYYSVGIPPPRWSDVMEFTVQIGHHRFYRG